MSWIDELDADEKPKLPLNEEAKELTALADKYEEYEYNIKAIEDALTNLRAEFLRLRRETIPDRMLELGVKKFVLSDGTELAYKKVCNATVLKEEEAFEWLEANDFGDCVKDELTVSTTRLDSSVIDEMKTFLSDFKNVSFKEKVSVHHMTLGALIKELVEDGKAVPSDLFNVYIGNVASLKKGKSDE